MRAKADEVVSVPAKTNVLTIFRLLARSNHKSNLRHLKVKV